jgi:hypothetical protein
MRRSLDSKRNEFAVSQDRGDDSAAAGRLYDLLEQEFGKNNLFMDVTL